jgi:hypothetical protein
LTFQALEALEREKGEMLSLRKNLKSDIVEAKFKIVA